MYQIQIIFLFFTSYIGLKQGDPSSPLLFMLFVNDIVNNINADLNYIFTIHELKLFLILFADDQVVFAKSPQTLQSILKRYRKLLRNMEAENKYIQNESYDF